MNEYKELIEKLEHYLNLGDAPIGRGWGTIIDKQTLKDAIDTIESLANEKETAERKLQSETKLKAIKDLCMSVPDCGVCLLSIGKTCPTKNWRDWTADEIETAFDIIYGGEAEK